MTFVVLIVLLVVAVLLAAWATHAVVRDEFSSQGQRRAQLALVWLLPFAGSLLTLYLKRAQVERPTGHYRAARDPGEDFSFSGQSVRETKEVIESGHAVSGEASGTE
jgi:hypothetical protein